VACPLAQLRLLWGSAITSLRRHVQPCEVQVVNRTRLPIADTLVLGWAAQLWPGTVHCNLPVAARQHRRRQLLAQPACKSACVQPRPPLLPSFLCLTLWLDCIAWNGDTGPVKAMILHGSNGNHND
jgi:hypothetical protein